MLHNFITMHGAKKLIIHNYTHKTLHCFVFGNYTSCLYAPGHVDMQ